MLVARVFLKLCTLLVMLVFVSLADSGKALGFTYNGFRSANLSLDGIAEFTNNGLLKLTNDTKNNTGHAFYPDPINFKNSSNGEALSFSTTFVFAIRSEFRDFSAQGLAFVIAPTKILPGGMTMELLGIFTAKTNGSATSHIFAVELDTIQNTDTDDVNDNHLAIDINSINAIKQEPAGYYSRDHDNGSFENLTIWNGMPMQVWVDYDGTEKQINVTLAPFKAGKPGIPLLSLIHDLSPVLKQNMYVGFSASTGPVVTNHYILGWSLWTHGGEMAQQLDLSQLPKLPRIGPKKVSSFLTLWLPLICVLTVLAAVFSLIFYVRRKRKFAEVLEDWEGDYGPQRFKFKDLYTSTKGFKDTELLGTGGFGSVYRGTLPTTELQIAVKRISHQSRQGVREFVAEIASLGRMSHRNLVPLLGYCRREGELLLVYEYMPNGSLDRFLYGPQTSILNWSQRFRIIKGVASGLFYLHQGWEQVVVHRDIKASNVLLDGELNGRLGDFGLAKLYDHGTDPQSTHVVGTVGYLAPEHYRTGRATTSTDVYAFGAFLLEVACGRRPIEPRVSTAEDLILVDWVFWCWNTGRILEAVDPRLGNDFNRDEVELVLKLGLLCSNSEPMARPSMQNVVLYLDASMPLPELSSAGVLANGIGFADFSGFEDVPAYSSSTGNAYSESSHVSESLLSGGR